MQTTAYMATHRGVVRDGNEDFGLVDPELGLYIVCDGMGGHSAGEVASRTAAERIQAGVREGKAALAQFDMGRATPDALVTLLRQSIEAASRHVLQMGREDAKKKGMGTTSTAVLVRGGTAILGHVGDSRCYLFRAGQVHQLSDDHTFVAEAVRKGLFTPEQAAKSAHGNLLTRAVGTQTHLEVDTLVFEMIPGDLVLLCSDGLHQYTPERDELAKIIATTAPESLPDRLISLANERGGTDNITVAAVTLPAVAATQDQESRRALRVTQNLEALRRIEIFGDLSMAELARVSSAFRMCEKAAGEVILTEGEESETLFVLVHGAAEVTREGQALAALGPGAHFGEMALLSQRPRSATVRATEPCVLLVLERNDLYGLLRQDAVMAVGILWRLAQTLSLRLDELYLLRPESLFGPPPQAAAATGAADTPGAGGRFDQTLRFGLFPGPFDRPR